MSRHVKGQAAHLADVWPATATLPPPSASTTTPKQTQACPCGEDVTADRVADAWVFYCQRCGSSWELPAPRERKAPRPRRARVKCRCERSCRFCGGERR